MVLFSRPRVTADPHLAADLPLVAAARAGDPGPLADRLATLAAQGRWNHRDTVIRAAAGPGDPGDTGWLDAWENAHPDRAEPALVRGEVLLEQAWAVRTGRRARWVSDHRFARFHQLLDEAGDHLDATARAHPADPSAWAPLIGHAKGLQLGVDYLYDLIGHARGAHGDGFAWRAAACDFLSPWWFGSAEEAWAFATTSAAEHPGTRNLLLPTLAASRALWHEDTTTGQAMLADALPAALAYVHGCAADEFEQVHTANLVAAALVVANLSPHAAPFLEIAGDRVDTDVWGRWFTVRNPAALFAQHRRAILGHA